MTQPKLLTPDDFLRPPAGLPLLDGCKYKFLAQGDSWFSIGSVLAPETTNILMEIDLAQYACVCNCARPGATLQHMVKEIRDPNFQKLLFGRQRWKWDGILMSAGGNDLIDAFQVLPNYADGPNRGKPIPLDGRILLKSNEWKPGSGADRYISDEGWKTFSDHLRDVFAELQALRDHPKSQSQGVHIIVHCYDYLLARDASAGLQVGPWLFPAVKAYRIPPSDWAALGVVLIDKFRTLLNSISVPNLHVVTTTPGTLNAAAFGSTGESNDWQNEIHPTREGYKKLAKKYAAVVDQYFP